MYQQCYCQKWKRGVRVCYTFFSFFLFFFLYASECRLVFKRSGSFGIVSRFSLPFFFFLLLLFPSFHSSPLYRVLNTAGFREGEKRRKMKRCKLSLASSPLSVSEAGWRFQPWIIYETFHRIRSARQFHVYAMTQITSRLIRLLFLFVLAIFFCFLFCFL